MSFTNLTPQKFPDGKPIVIPGVLSGTYYFYFTFVPTTTSVAVFLRWNIYNNKACICGLYNQSSDSLLTVANISNVTTPTIFVNGKIGISTSIGRRYTNTTNVPNFVINNLIIGTRYILETVTIYNEMGTDFSAIFKSGNVNLPFIYTSATRYPEMFAPMGPTGPTGVTGPTGPT